MTPVDDHREGRAESSESLRILTVTNRWPGQGFHGGIFVKQLVDSLRARGHTVDIEVITQGRGRLDYVLGARRVRRLAQATKYDVLHAHYGLTMPAASAVAGIPRVGSLYGSDINVWWQRWISRLALRSYDARIYVSRRLAVRAGDTDGWVIPNGVDFDLFAPRNRETARAMLGARPGDRLVLFGGSPKRKVKGWDLFREVIVELEARGIRVKPVVLTEPGQPRRRIAEKLDAADLLLFTSNRDSEGSPTVVKEAIVIGLPVVSVDVGDVAELLAAVWPSAVVPYPSDRRLRGRSELVTRLADEAAAILEQGGRANGREVHRSLELDRVAASVIRVYQTVLTA